MSRVTCECGQSFYSRLMNGASRQNCPFCGRRLATEGESATAATEAPVAPAPAEKPSEESISPISLVAARKRSAPQQSLGDQLFPRASMRLEGYVPPSPHPRGKRAHLAPSSASRQRPGRFRDPQSLERGWRDVYSELRAAAARRQGAGAPATTKAGGIACPRGGGCQVDQCPRAFACGALPNRGVNYRSVLAAGAVGGLVGTIAFVARASRKLAFMDNPKLFDWAVLSVPFVFFAFVVLAVGGQMWFWSNRRRAARAIAKAVSRLDVTFQYFHRLKPYATQLALPLLHPGRMTEAEVVATGRVDSQELAIVEYAYEYERPKEDAPRGEGGKPLYTMRKKDELMRQIVFAFPEPTPLPDFVIGKAESDAATAYFTRQTHRLGFVAHPLDVGLANAKTHRYAIAFDAGALQRSFSPPLVQLLQEHPEWRLQVVGGRLFAWRDQWSVGLFKQMPAAPEGIAADARTAAQIRRLLIGG